MWRHAGSFVQQADSVALGMGTWDLSTEIDQQSSLCPLHCKVVPNHWTTREVPRLKVIQVE